MSSASRISAAIVIGVCLLLADAGNRLVGRWSEAFALNDPDRYFHLALSRQAAQDGLFLGRIPQIVGLGWDRIFVDKEFLFHFFSGLAYRLNGEGGVLAMIPVFALASVFFLLLAVSGSASRLHAGVLKLLTACVLAFGIFWFLSPRFLLRVGELRPQVLAIACFALLLCGLCRRSLLFSALGGALFALAYHALYVPLALIAAALAFGRDWPLRRAALAGAIGLTAGLLSHPHWLSYLAVVKQHLMIALGESGWADLGIGAELVPLSGREYFRLILLPAALLLCCIWPDWRIPRTERWLVPVTGLFWLLVSSSPRAIEYAVPLTVVLGATWILSSYGFRTILRSLVLAVLAIGLQLGIAIAGFRSDAPLNPRVEETLRAVAAIPHDPAHTRVFNCEWTRGPYILYARPELQFIDVLDPGFLKRADPQLHEKRAALLRGDVPDALEFIRGELKFDYVLCQSPVVIEQLEHEPGFQRLYPQSPSPRDFTEGNPRLYAVAEGTPRSWVKNWEVSDLGATNEQAYLKLSAKSVSDWRSVEPLSPAASYLDLRGFLRKSDSADCVAVRPVRSEIARAAGATTLAFGGGRNIRLWFNGEELFASSQAIAQPSIVYKTMQLPRALKASDRIEAVVCSATRSPIPFMGFSLSLMGALQGKHGP